MLKNENLMKELEEKENFKTIDSPSKIVNVSFSDRHKIIRSLIIKKIEQEQKLKKFIKTEIDDYFNSPEKYFDNNSPVFVNKKVDLKAINIFQKPINARHMTNKKSNKLMTSFSQIKKPSGKISASHISLGNNILNNDNAQLQKYEIIDNEKLKDIFESFHNNHNYKRSFTKDNNIDLTDQNFPLDISKSLSVQKNRLNSSRNNQKNFRQMSGFLSKRLNKYQKDLLINSVDSYRYKKEIIKDINNKKFSEIHPRYYWKMNLRRGKDTKRKDIYVNIKSNYDPFFAVLVDNYEKKNEIMIKSGMDLNCKEVKDFKKNKYLIDNYKNKINNLENLRTLSLKGKKLYDVEFNREMSSKRRKILHRVFIENGKEILDTDINDIFGEETFYKNYPKQILKYEKKNSYNNILNSSRNTNNII
jgi:hypothetical protein